MGAITSIPLCSRAKEDAAEKPGLPEAPSATVVNQPAPANVSLEIAEKLNQAKEEVEEEVDPSEAVSEGDGISLDHDSNQSDHLSGENIALDDDCDDGDEEEEEEEEEKEERPKENGIVVGSKSDTAAKITDLLSELASQCESQEVIQSR